MAKVKLRKEKMKRFWEVFLQGPEWLNTPDIYLYSNYRSSTFAMFCWFYGLLIRKFTTPGYLIFFATIIILPYSSISLQTPARYLAFALLSMFTIDFIIGWIFRPKLKIDRKAPERARAGSEIEMVYHIKNLRRVPAWDLKLDPFQMQKGLYWQKHGETPCLDSRKEMTLTARLNAERRGKYTIYSPIADSTFPLSLFKWSRRQKKSGSNLLIYPNYYSLNSLNLPHGKKYQREGNSRISKVGESLDFFGCRDFRTGDDPRHIHWPSSARTGELIVREYQEEYLSRIALIVDTQVTKVRSFRLSGRPKDYFEELEAALSLTAALVDYLTQEEYVVDIFAAGSQIYHFKTGRSLACLDSILDILACIEPNHNTPIQDLTTPVMQEISGIGNCVVILLGWNQSRKDFVRKLQHTGIALKLIIIDNINMKNKDDLPPPQEALLINPLDVMSGKVRNL